MKPLEYLNHALAIIEAHAYYQPQLGDWDARKSDVVKRGHEATSITDTHPLLRELLNALGDHHSGLLIPEQVQVEQTYIPKLPQGHKIDRWGYVMLPTAAGDDAMMQQYADAAHDLICGMADARGWIVDLRENNGGNMWSMLAGVGVLAGEGEIGYFMDRNWQKVSWGHKQGASVYEGEPVYTCTEPPATVPPECPVAILTSRQTASSGEIMLVSFLGRDNVRLFGQPTRGIPTANEVYPLEDHALLILTQAVCADRNGTIYEQAIVPDVVCEDALERALAWLSDFAG